MISGVKVRNINMITPEKWNARRAWISGVKRLDLLTINARKKSPLKGEERFGRSPPLGALGG
jgi:hypothetical protein